MKKGLLFVLLITICFVVSGCGCQKKEKPEEVKKIDWTSEVTYVPNIPYEGVGTLTNTTSEFIGYTYKIDGATYDSANEYIKKLYENGYVKQKEYEVLGDDLIKPKEGSYSRLELISSNKDSKIMIVFYSYSNHKDGNYNLELTFLAPETAK